MPTGLGSGPTFSCFHSKSIESLSFGGSFGGAGECEHLAGLNTGTADLDAAVDPVEVGAYLVQIGEKAPAFYVVGVADCISRLRSLAANITYFCHRFLP